MYHEFPHHHILRKRAGSGVSGAHCLYLIGWQLFDDGVARQDGAPVLVQPFPFPANLGEADESGCLRFYPHREELDYQPDVYLSDSYREAIARLVRRTNPEYVHAYRFQRGVAAIEEFSGT